MRILNTIRRTINRLFGLNIKHSYRKRSPRRKQHVHVNSTNRMILGMINNERRKRHLSPLLFDQGLYWHSVRWSRIMADAGEIFHSNSEIENVCMVPTGGSHIDITKRMFHVWKKSQSHWDIMMDSSIEKAGFAYATKGKYAYGTLAFKQSSVKQIW